MRRTLNSIRRCGSRYLQVVVSIDPINSLDSQDTRGNLCKETQRLDAVPPGRKFDSQDAVQVRKQCIPI